VFKKALSALVILAAIILLGHSSFAQDFFFDSPRVAAMGGANVAIADDSDAVFYNPAGLGSSTNNDISANYGSLLGDVSQQSIVGSVGLGEYGKVGFGYDLTVVNSIPLTNSSGNSIGTSDFYSSETVISYGFPVYDWLLLGAKAHKLSSGLSEYYGEGYGLGMGFLLKPFQNFNLGLLIENIYATDFTWNNGSHEKIVKKATLGLSFQPIHNRILFAADLRGNTVGDIYSGSIGGEITFVEWLKIRLGTLFSKDDNANYIGTGSAGLGINLFNNLNVDYALQRLNGMKVDSQYISMGYKF
jgi:hypothetical protein